VLVAPAMNARMWAHPTVQDNLAVLRSRSVAVVDPVEGELACGEEGMGRLAEPERIVAEALRLARRSRSLEGERVLISAGPTREPIDPVRYLTNRSSGRMGYALAAAARRSGAEVTLVSGPVNLSAPWGVEIVPVRTAAEMAGQMKSRFPSSTICFMVAAVSDYRPAAYSETKIRRPISGEKTRQLELEPTEDILASLAAMRGQGQLLAGFAAETGDPEPAARKKLSEKGIDFIFANDVSRAGAGFDVGTNILIGLAADGERIELPLASKEELAEQILDWLAGKRGVAARRSRVPAVPGRAGEDPQ
jgi:phosphopantothenoylcysteine decarboxylase/phosphopantothenate--cysteine ligase